VAKGKKKSVNQRTFKGRCEVAIAVDRLLLRTCERVEVKERVRRKNAILFAQIALVLLRFCALNASVTITEMREKED
jgi:heme O synthase-like polyprenyltransferase